MMMMMMMMLFFFFLKCKYEEREVEMFWEKDWTVMEACLRTPACQPQSWCTAGRSRHDAIFSPSLASLQHDGAGWNEGEQMVYEQYR